MDRSVREKGIGKQRIYEISIGMRIDRIDKEFLDLLLSGLSAAACCPDSLSALKGIFLVP